MAKRNNTYPKLSIIKALYLRAFDLEYRMHPAYLHPQYLYERVYFLNHEWECENIATKINHFQNLSLLHDTEATGGSSQPKKKRRGSKLVMAVENWSTIGTKVADMDWELEDGEAEGKGDREILAMLVEIEEKAVVVDEKKKRLRGVKVADEAKEIILFAGEEPFKHHDVELKTLREGLSCEKEKNELKKNKNPKKTTSKKTTLKNTNPKKDTSKKTSDVNKPEKSRPEKKSQEKEIPEKHNSKKRKRNWILEM